MALAIAHRRSATRLDAAYNERVYDASPIVYERADLCDGALLFVVRNHGHDLLARRQHRDGQPERQKDLEEHA